MRFKFICSILEMSFIDDLGSGIYVLSGKAAAEYAGPAIIISFIIAGLVAILSALSMAEMSTMMSSAGSVYTYTYVGKSLITSVLFSTLTKTCFLWILALGGMLHEHVHHRMFLFRNSCL